MIEIAVAFLFFWLGFGVARIIDHDKNETGYLLDLSGKDWE